MKAKQKYSNLVFKTIMTIICTAAVTFTITMIWVYSQESVGNTETAIGAAAKSDKLSAKLSSIRSKIDNEYIGEIDENALIEGAIKGYVSGLNDVYSEYLTADEMQEFTENTVGEYVGIGVYITKDVENNEVVVYGTIPNSPAQEAGLKTGDIIREVDGTTYNGDDYDIITDKIKGKEGSKVKLLIIRDGEEINLEVERKNIEVEHVTSQVLDNNIGYIYISSFEGNTKNQFEKAYDELEDKGIKSLIIDIRNNGGGIVDEALGIAELMTDKDDILLIEKDKNENEIITKSTKDKKINMPIVLLVNQYSASASEILAGILKENVDNATLIGNKTYGKGVIQTLYPLSDNSGLKITTDEYYTPNHNEINKVGIEPDIKIDDYIYTGELDLKNDTQLKRAIEELTK